MRRVAATASIACLAAIASAEPVAVTFPLFDEQAPFGVMGSMRLTDYDARLPDLVVFAYNQGGAGISEIAPAVEPSDANSHADCNNPIEIGGLVSNNDHPDWFLFEGDTLPGTPIPGGSGNWVNPRICNQFFSALPTLRFDDNEFYNIFFCEYTEDNSEILELSPVLHYPIRVAEPGGSYLYGWIAVQVIDLFNAGCDPACADIGVTSFCSLPVLRIVGAGFETEPNTPIIVGGGLCRADLNFDAVLDLADLQAFIAAFIAQDDAADFDDNSILDLTDIFRFVEAFETNCGL